MPLGAFVQVYLAYDFFLHVWLFFVFLAIRIGICQTADKDMV